MPQEDGTRARKIDHALRWAVFLLYAAATFLITLRHEPWADELQAWLIARDCTVPEIFHAMRWEGHFVPWYLMLHVFAANGGPVLCMNLVSSYWTVVSSYTVSPTMNLTESCLSAKNAV